MVGEGKECSSVVFKLIGDRVDWSTSAEEENKWPNTVVTN